MPNYLIKCLELNARLYATEEFCRAKEPGASEWTRLTWAAFADLVRRCARALLALGAEEKTMAAICSPNRPEALAMEFACFYHRICPVPIYAYSAQEQYDFIAGNCGARLLFAGAREQYLLARSYASSHPWLNCRIVLLCPPAGVLDPDDSDTLTWGDFLSLGEGVDMDAVLDRCERGEDSDLASLIYTSGTTAEPKGVMLTHANFNAAISEHLKRLPEIRHGELSLCFLPMSHVFEKAWTFFCIAKGLRIAFNYDPRHVEETLKATHPNLMCCVPRFWEKVYTAIIGKIHAMPSWQRLLVKRAWACGARYNLHYKRLGLKPTWLCSLEYGLWDRTIFARVRREIGIPEPNFFPTAGAALSDKIIGTMRKMGIEVIFGYGMTETTATVTCYPSQNYQIGTVGTPMPMVEVRIADDGEILVKGATITPGYYNNPKVTAESFTHDGFLLTGDAGYINPQGALVLTHRKKDLFKTSGGKYISPAIIEALLTTSPYIDQAAVIADTRKYPSALLVPNFANLRHWAEKQGILDLSRQSLCSNPEVISLLQGEVKKLQAKLSSYEKIKKITLIPEPFTTENGLLTNTLKLRRRDIDRHHAAAIEAMYPQEYLQDAPMFNNRHR